MPSGLKRYQTTGHDHFITFTCYHRFPYLNDDHARDLPPFSHPFILGVSRFLTRPA